MGGVGSDIAVDAADIALVNDDIKELPHLIRLARRMMVTIKCNLSFSMALNFVAIVLAITGILNPVVGALVHNAGSVLVIINSSLLLKWSKTPPAFAARGVLFFHILLNPPVSGAAAPMGHHKDSPGINLALSQNGENPLQILAV